MKYANKSSFSLLTRLKSHKSNIHKANTTHNISSAKYEHFNHQDFSNMTFKSLNLQKGNNNHSKTDLKKDEYFCSHLLLKKTINKNIKTTIEILILISIGSI